MKTVSVKLVTVIAEAILEDQLLRDLKNLGVKGYTLSEVRGEGSRGIRASEWEGKNLKIEVLVSPEVADAIIDHVAEHYFPLFAVVAYVQDVNVVRGEKFV